MSYVGFKAGVTLDGASPELAIGFPLMVNVFRDRDLPLVVTSVTDGKHGNNSLHYRGRAMDLRLPSRYTSDRNHDSEIKDALAKVLGENWDCVLESDHIHVEYQPKPKMIGTEAT